MCNTCVRKLTCISHIIHSESEHIHARVIKSKMNFPRNLYKQEAIRLKRSAPFITSTLNYIDNLISCNLPVIFSRQHLAILTGMSRYDMDKILENREYYYKYYLIKKKRGGFRRIIAPYKQLKELQRWIKENIIDQVDINQFATGFVKDKSIYHNAKIHVRCKCYTKY